MFTFSSLKLHVNTEHTFKDADKLDFTYSTSHTNLSVQTKHVLLETREKRTWKLVLPTLTTCTSPGTKKQVFHFQLKLTTKTRNRNHNVSRLTALVLYLLSQHGLASSAVAMSTG